MPRRLALALLVSGEGTLLEALAEDAQSGRLPARIVIVVADRPHVRAIERARQRGFPTEVLPLRGASEERWSAALDALLRAQGAELCLLAGFLSLLPAPFLQKWKGRVLNVHPSLLPKHGGRGMYGLRVHAAVLAAGEARTGATVHLVTEALDAGPILAQKEIPVEMGETPDRLRERVRSVEVEALTEVLRRLAEGRIVLPIPPDTPRISE
ncbi:MAG: phosphoribosylglycinamide formyltransferase [Thermoplasmata archaeon]|nr:phosphoribosylglycinamide formyltransferase [Thermoplasmata archaeon]